MKPAAKRVGSLTYKQTGTVQMHDTPKKMVTVDAWFHGRDLDYTSGFMRYGVRYQNGRLIVPLTGTYNIYSFLSLTENYDSPEERVQDRNTTLVAHAMYKYNVKLGQDVELASSVQTHRQSTNRNFNAFSSHISTLVQLEAGDEISVKISDISLTSYPGDNFFGIHMI
uniref:Tumor necrosis factor-like protein n=1 Tax=Dreissena rostriformis bugensis TaxID=427924 RepID=B7SH88_9BIVA|nr:tumor necrosis factor-like protein [Dreissena rostriformis bugensis]